VQVFRLPDHELLDFLRVNRHCFTNTIVNLALPKRGYSSDLHYELLQIFEPVAANICKVDERAMDWRANHRRPSPLVHHYSFDLSGRYRYPTCCGPRVEHLRERGIVLRGGGLEFFEAEERKWEKMRQERNKWRRRRDAVYEWVRRGIAS